jgi:DNA-binding XRE family transcriptional regulator
MNMIGTVDHNVFDDDTYYPRLFEDLKSASGLVLIQSPYLGVNRIERAREHMFQLIRRGIPVCAFVRLPDDWNSKSKQAQETMALLRGNVRTLEEIGLHVNLRPHIHEKIVTIGDRILYDGSLNTFSQNKSSERMTRFVDRDKTIAAIVKHRLYTCDRCTAERPLTAFRDDDSVLTYISKCVVKKRESLGITQHILALAAGVPQKTIADLERARRNVEIKTLSRVCRVLGLELLLANWYVAPIIHRYIEKQSHPGT